MPDREKVIKGLKCAIGIRGVKDCDNCPYDYDFHCLGCDIVMWDALALLKEQEAVDAHQRDKFMRSWRMIKFSVIDTANNNAGPDGNEDVYRILTWVATMMDNQEKGW